jgi:hypothetical protein
MPENQRDKQRDCIHTNALNICNYHLNDDCQMTDYHFCCSKCGARFDLSTKYGIKAAQYGLCRKCGVEFVISTYKKSNFLAKVFFFIPYLLIKMAYKKEFKN